MWLSQPSFVERLNSLEKTIFKLIISNCENRQWLFIIILFLLIFEWLWKISLLECIIKRKRLNQGEKKHSQYDKIQSYTFKTHYWLLHCLIRVVFGKLNVINVSEIVNDLYIFIIYELNLNWIIEYVHFLGKNPALYDFRSILQQS